MPEGLVFGLVMAVVGIVIALTVMITIAVVIWRAVSSSRRAVRPHWSRSGLHYGATGAAAGLGIWGAGTTDWSSGHHTDPHDPLNNTCSGSTCAGGSSCGGSSCSGGSSCGGGGCGGGGGGCGGSS